MKKYLTYKDTLVAPGSDLYEMLQEKQTPEMVRKIEYHYQGVDLAFRKSHGLPWDWRPIDKAPKVPGQVMWLKGQYSGATYTSPVEVKGSWVTSDDPAFWPGWRDSDGISFEPTHWCAVD